MDPQPEQLQELGKRQLFLKDWDAGKPRPDYFFNSVPVISPCLGPERDEAPFFTHQKQQILHLTQP